MCNPFWNNALKRVINQTNDARLRVALVGLGHELCGDDAAGVMVARGLQTMNHRHVHVVDAGCAPENVGGELIRYAPELILFVDAVHFDSHPGTVCLFDVDEIQRNSPTTHALSVHLLVEYLRASIGCSIWLLGIQPAQMTLGAVLSPAVQNSVADVVRTLSVTLGNPSICGENML